MAKYPTTKFTVDWSGKIPVTWAPVSSLGGIKQTGGMDMASSNMMTLDVFADYYSLQAIIADRRASEHPDIVGEARNQLARISAPIAACFADYMFLICMGEARHAVGSSNLWYWKEIPKADGRVGAYRFAAQYDPLKVLPQLSDLFGQDHWGGSYGGKKWKHIADVALSYRKGEMSDPVYIDHVADLKHNGGTQFSKSEVSQVIPFTPVWSSDYYKLESFLTYKRDTLDYFSNISQSYFKSLSLPVGRLVIQYMQKLRLKPDLWQARAPIAYEPFKFGDKELSGRTEPTEKPSPSYKSSSSSSKPQKLDDSMYLSEDEMYDPAEAKHDPKVSGPTDSGEPVGDKPGLVKPSSDGYLEPEPITSEPETAKEKGEASKDEPTTDDFASWLVSASTQLP